MLTKVARPCSMPATMVAKWSSSSTRSAASRATSVPDPAHGDADVGLVQRRAVVDAVAGHGHDVTAGPQRPGDPQLVLGRHPGDDDAVVVEQRAEDAVVVGEVLARQDRVVGGPQSPTSCRRSRAPSPDGRR